MLSIIVTLLFFGFMIPISYNMLMLIQTQRRQYNFEDEIKIKRANKSRIKRIVLFFVLLIVSTFLVFFGNYLFTH